MSQYSTLTGEVSHLSKTSTTSGSTNRHGGSVNTTHTLSFRVNGKPVIYTGTPSIDNGDEVTVVGDAKGGEFKALAVRNETTNVLYSPKMHSNIAIVVLLVLGIPGSFILAGIPLVIIAGVFIYKNKKSKEVVTVLNMN